MGWIEKITDKKVLLLIGIISILVLAFAIIFNNLNHSFFVQLIFNDALEFANKGIITSNFMPIGYSGFVGSCLRINGERGIPACQTFIYAGILLSAFFFLKLRNVKGGLLALGILIVSLHPIMLLNVWRIHDGNLTALLLLGFLATGISFLHFRNTWSVLALGVLTGFLIITRSNTIALILPAFLLFSPRSGEKKKKPAIQSAIFLIIVLVLMASINIAVKQKPFFFPNQGFYNFFSGTNEYAGKYLLKDYSGENSLDEALASRGFSGAERFSFPSQKYKELAIDYIKKHPLEYIKLTGLKIFTFFRPGFNSGESIGWSFRDIVEQFLKIILATPFFVWLFFLYKTRQKIFDKENLFIIISVALYLIPFFLANADPRYRFPLDIIFIVDSFCLWQALKKRPA